MRVAEIAIRMFMESFLLFVMLLRSHCTRDGFVKRFEYKVSFKPPNITTADGTIPFWDFGKDAIPGAKQIRLTPSVPGKRGWMWSKRYLEATEWEIETTFKITGNGRTGGDGMAIWFTSERGRDGPVFGSNDYWKGLGIFLDSYDNDAKNNNPLVSVVINNGTLSYDHERDGDNQLSGGCVTDYRNKRYPTSLKIEYVNKVLTVYINDGTFSPGEYKLCTRVDNVELPTIGYLGLSASTGDIADDHDVSEFLVHVYVPQEHAVREDAEARKQLDDYLKRVENIRRAQEEYARQHPEKVKQYTDKTDTFFDREMQMLFDMQNEMRQTVNVVLSKINELIGRQESFGALVNRLNDGIRSKPGLAGSPIDATSPSTLRDIQTMLASQRSVVDSLNRLSSSIQEMYMFMRNHPAGSSAAVPDSWRREVSEKLGVLINRKASREGTKEMTLTCASTRAIFFIACFQLAILISFFVIYSRTFQNAKKFY